MLAMRVGTGLAGAEVSATVPRSHREDKCWVRAGGTRLKPRCAVCCCGLDQRAGTGRAHKARTVARRAEAKGCTWQLHIHSLRTTVLGRLPDS